ncbi:MAG TPA: OsmC family protein [Candidatus Acidoferrum sp.]|nr:OsmC family protein [Candidatus Acidoferrum sp.]
MTAEASLPQADAVCEGGDLDCGSGLLLIIRSAMEPLAAGGVLELRSREISVREDLPAWCRLVGHTLLAVEPGHEKSLRYFIRKKGSDESFHSDLEQARSHAWLVRVRWTGEMQSQAFVRNHAFVVGQPASFDTQDAAPSALEYLLAALGGCLVAGFQWRASRRGIQIQNLEVSLKAQADNILVFLGIEESGHPGLRCVEGSLYVEADADHEVLQALWEETQLRCPITQSLVHQVSVHISLKRA